MYIFQVYKMTVQCIVLAQVTSKEVISLIILIITHYTPKGNYQLFKHVEMHVIKMNLIKNKKLLCYN